MHAAVVALITERAERSLVLLEGLHQALIVLGRPELARIANMALEDASAAATAIQLWEARKKRSRKQAVFDGLKTLAGMSGRPGVPVAVRSGRVLARL